MTKKVKKREKVKISLTTQDIRKFEEWIIENIDETVVPNDEGNADALVYNLIHLLRGDNRKYDYQPEQDKEIEFLSRLIPKSKERLGR